MKYRITSPEGQTFEITAPDGASQEEILAYAQKNVPRVAKPADQPKPSGLTGYDAYKNIPAGESAPRDNGTPWAEVGKKAVGNFVPSLIDRASELAALITTPEGRSSLASIPDNIRKMVLGNLESWIPGTQGHEVYASAPDVYAKQRYGSTEALKKTLSEDPAGAMLDAAAITGGASAALKGVGMAAPNIAPITDPLARQAGAVSNAVNPIMIAGKGLKYAGKALGWTLKELTGITTGTSPQTVSEAVRAGWKRDRSFWDNLTGKANKTDVIDDMKANLNTMRQNRAKDYRSGIFDIKNDKTVLDFNAIDQAVNKASGQTSFKGISSRNSASKYLDEMRQIVDDWKNLDPAEYHTPEGFDFLKRQLGEVYEKIPYNERTARMVAGGVYNAAKRTISDQAPVYDKVMSDYSKASDLISELERTFSLKDTASADTTMRKLQSLMRNNVNTSYGNRLTLAKQMINEGGKDVMPALAGQAMEPWASRGLHGRLENIATLGAAYFNPAILATLPAQSPKLVGAAAYGLGAAGNSLSKFPSRDAALYAAMLKEADAAQP